MPNEDTLPLEVIQETTTLAEDDEDTYDPDDPLNIDESDSSESPPEDSPKNDSAK